MIGRKPAKHTRKPASAGKPAKDGFSRREREIMDALYSLGKATAAQILERIPDPPTYTAIRTHLTILEKKGHVRHASDGTRYVYEPRVARAEMGRRAIETVLKTFYGDSVERVVAALLSREETNVSREELERLARLIEKAKEEGR
jgi:predicted transcriptional regulator